MNAIRWPTAVLCLLLAACDRAAPQVPTAPAKPASSGLPATSGIYDAVEKLAKDHKEKEALDALEPLRAAHGKEEDFLVREAELQRRLNEPEKAILLLRTEIAARPELKGLYVPLGQLYLEAGLTDLAIETLKAGEAHGAPVSQVGVALGSAIGQKGDLDGAIAQFERAEKAGAQRDMVLYNKALALDRKQDFAAARDALEEALKLRPGWRTAQRELGRVLVHGWPQDRKVVDRAMDLLVAVHDDPAFQQDWRLMEGIGDAWLVIGDYAAAIESYTDALRFGKNPPSVNERYVVAVRKQREAQAAADAKK